ncbi:hypothetical protein K466DRAFT_588035 [Polyporus arcularius HHB13444]|uniref:CFEM domain-containing protein n=1 Tax=Polyporus arcularius HHB13444 TaxID=1314778 RepID=A0A5C3P9D7_9APHY|nr:hypothetical protein K466DRAFT_588035 [Polyporus arcularius HHB13444]
MPGRRGVVGAFLDGGLLLLLSEDIRRTGLPACACVAPDLLGLSGSPLPLELVRSSTTPTLTRNPHHITHDLRRPLAMPNMSLFTQQPRWLLLSVFLVLWSWSSGFRRDGNRAKALGLGVEARSPPFEGTWQEKRQVGLPVCAQRCALEATQDIGCGTGLNFACACHQPNFMADAVNCMTGSCSTNDKATGQSFLMLACKQVGTSVSLPTSFSVSSTSITSGIPPVCTTGSPTSAASGTTTVSVTVTITAGPSGAPSSSSSSSAVSPSSSVSVSVPVVTVTATATATASSTTTAPTTSRSATTVVATSTLGGAPSGSGASGGGNGAVGLLEGVPVLAVGAALAAVFAGMAVVL